MRIDHPYLRQLGNDSRPELSGLQDELFSFGLQKIRRYTIRISVESIIKDSDGLPTGKTRERLNKYSVELHEYNGFAMIKFYPRNFKEHPNKYKLRSVELGFIVPRKGIMRLLNACTYLMKKYLEVHPDNFIGYVGQPDIHDDFSKNHNDTAQRARIYNRWVWTKFQSHKYSFVEPHIFEKVNINLVRKARPSAISLNDTQQANYSSFLKSFRLCRSKHREFMTLYAWEESKSDNQ